jgi:hypothetical protein
MKTFTNKWNQTFTVKIGDVMFFKSDVDRIGTVKDIHFSANQIKIDIGNGVCIMVDLENCWKEDL